MLRITKIDRIVHVIFQIHSQMSIEMISLFVLLGGLIIWNAIAAMIVLMYATIVLTLTIVQTGCARFVH